MLTARRCLPWQTLVNSLLSLAHLSLLSVRILHPANYGFNRWVQVESPYHLDTGQPVTGQDPDTPLTSTSQHMEREPEPPR